MKQKTARMISTALERDAQYSSKGRKGFVGAMPLPPELKKFNGIPKRKSKV
ncbi:hypothetical protein [Paenibacillus polymyxa]|uniref:hypothetical protein n=1 Tax=Paenibacillus polymyxa TaxID=1406 RepID=UPI0015D623F3|nr:hypothetical protein [Paenibacillus polymyxa]